MYTCMFRHLLQLCAVCVWSEAATVSEARADITPKAGSFRQRFTLQPLRSKGVRLGGRNLFWGLWACPDTKLPDAAVLKVKVKELRSYQGSLIKVQ